MKEQTEVVVLPNGLRLIFDPIDRVRTCAFGIWVRSGVGYESPAQIGISHMIEHMVFRGTKTRTSLEIARQTDEIGGTLNAYTARDHTCFYAHTLREHVPKALEILCDMLTAPRFDPDDLEAEKRVVLEEYAMYEDSPEDFCSDLFFENAWRGSTFGANVLGTRETIEAMTREALLAHMLCYYTPERMIVAFSGSFDRDAVTAICETYFGARPCGTLPQDRPRAVYTPFLMTREKEFTQNQLVLGFEGEAFDDLERYHAAGFLSLLLTGTASSRLFQRLRDALGLVYSVDSCNYGFPGSSLFTISMGLNAEAEPQAISETIAALRFLPETLTSQEFAIVRAHALTRFEMRGESVSSRVAYHAENLMDYGRLLPRAEDRAISASITQETVCSVARRIFDFDRISRCAVGRVRSAADYRAILKEALQAQPDEIK